MIKSLGWGATEYRESDEALFDSIADLCGKTLTELRINLHRVDFNTKSQFQALEALELCDASGINFRMHSQLKSLKLCSKLEGSKPIDDWIVQAFPLLKEVVFHQQSELTDDVLIRFCTLNPQLQRLGLYECYKLTTSIFQNIGSRLPNLKSLSANGDSWRISMDANMAHLAGLRKLKVLHIRADNVSARELVALLAEHEVPIVHLGIHMKSHDLRNAIPELKHLKKIQLHSISDELLINIVKSYQLKTKYNVTFSL